MSDREDKTNKPQIALTPLPRTPPLVRKLLLAGALAGSLGLAGCGDDDNKPRDAGIDYVAPADAYFPDYAAPADAYTPDYTPPADIPNFDATVDSGTPDGDAGPGDGGSDANG